MSKSFRPNGQTRRRQNTPKMPPDKKKLYVSIQLQNVHLVVLLRLFLLRADAPQAAGAAGRDEADLLTRRRETVRRGGVADVLVVTTTEGVLHWVHRHTTHVGPLVALHAEPVNRQNKQNSVMLYVVEALRRGSEN